MRILRPENLSARRNKRNDRCEYLTKITYIYIYRLDKPQFVHIHNTNECLQCMYIYVNMITYIHINYYTYINTHLDQTTSPVSNPSTRHLPGLKDSTDSWHILTWEPKVMGLSQTGWDGGMDILQLCCTDFDFELSSRCFCESCMERKRIANNPGRKVLGEICLSFQFNNSKKTTCWYYW